MESSRPKEKWKIKEHITPRNGDRHDKNEQELDETRKEVPGQSGWKLVCSLPEKAAVDDIRSMDVEYPAWTTICKYLYMFDDVCCSSPSFSSI
ncbi:unnamed protein product [Schistosoma margrebowiei]|uniref:Uncharacterized protein n=1 Tax=Schistosoma margrebowiei TaxID=48269 RepID=A0A183MIQ9_9TREM|nr:unnamed protein product [Schistosoma margrebowiei]